MPFFSLGSSLLQDQQPQLSSSCCCLFQDLLLRTHWHKTWLLGPSLRVLTCCCLILGQPPLVLSPVPTSKWVKMMQFLIRVCSFPESSLWCVATEVGNLIVVCGDSVNAIVELGNCYVTSVTMTDVWGVVRRVGEHQHRLTHRCSRCESFAHTWSVKLDIYGLNGWGIYSLNGWGSHYKLLFRLEKC